jgi:hypothetical protein
MRRSMDATPKTEHQVSLEELRAIRAEQARLSAALEGLLSAVPVLRSFAQDQQLARDLEADRADRRQKGRAVLARHVAKQRVAQSPPTPRRKRRA